VHEIAAELGVDSKFALAKLKELGEFVKSPSSTVEPPVARKLRAAIEPVAIFSYIYYRLYANHCTQSLKPAVLDSKYRDGTGSWICIRINLNHWRRP
jgi:hypothetical protein